MQSVSSTIGETNAYYTRVTWSGTKTAGLLLEGLDNTENAVPDHNNRITSLKDCELWYNY
jgi:hypothetical protein